MKKIFVSFLIAVLCIAAAVSVSAYDGADRLTVEAPKFTPAIDGVRDDGYGPLYTVEQVGAAHTDGLDLTTGQVSVAWDDGFLYFYCECYDNNEPYAVSKTDWQCDGPEFFLDLLHDMAPSYDADDFRVRVIAAYDKEGSIWENPLSYNGHNNNDPVNNACDDDFNFVIKMFGDSWSDGYAVEMAYEYENYGYTFTPGNLIGFEVQICDDVFGFGTRDSQAFLGNPADVAFTDPSQFGADIKLVENVGDNVDISTATVERELVYCSETTEGRVAVEANFNTPVIDGTMDAGYGALTDVNLRGVATADGVDLTPGKVALAWDDSNLYFYCEVADNNEGYAVSGTDWQCDGPEYFLDLLNDKATSYAFDDYRIRIIAAYDKEGSVWTTPYSFDASAVDADNDCQVVIRQLGDKWADGYAVELAFNYANHGFSYVNGNTIGFEVQICDDIFGNGSRDSQAFLGNPDDIAWADPSLFGADIILTGAEDAAPAEVTPAEETPVEEPSVEETPVEDTPVEEVIVEAPVVTETEEAPAAAPQTFDAVIISSIAAVVSLAGYAVSRKH